MLGLGLGTSKGGFVDVLAEVTNTKSIIFDGVDDHIDCGNAIVTSYPFTVAGWLKPTLNNGLQVLTLSDVSASNVYYSIAWNSSNVFQLQARNTSVKKISSQTYGSLGGWYHIVGVFTSATDRTLYVNGVKDHSGEENLDSVTFNSNIDTTTLGALNRPSPSYGTGNLDEIAIWNDSLTANEVTQIYNSNKATLDLSTDTGDYTSASNLQAWWRMETLHGSEWNPHASGSGLVINDLAGTETLGSNLVSDATWANASSESQPFETFTTSGNQIIQASNTTGHGTCATSTFSLEVNAFYKLSFNLGYTADDADNDPISIVGVGVGTTLGSAPRPFQITSHTTTGSQTYYFKVPSSRSDYRFGFQAGNNKVLTITLSDLSIQKVTGKNFGTMENMASSAIETDTPVQIYTVANTKSILLSTDDFINFGDQQLMTTAGTVSVWTKFTAGSTIQTLVGKYNATNGDREFWLNIQADEKPEWNVQSAIGSYDANTKAKSGTALSEDTWNHIVGTFSANNAPKLYVNGVLVATASSNIDADGLGDGDEPIFIGKNVNGTTDGDFLNGNIDEVAIWNTELSASQVAQIYHGSQANFDLSQNGGGYTSASNLQAWWRMGDGTIDDFTLIGDQTDTSLQSNIIDSTKFFREEDGTSGGWTPYGSNSLSITSDSVTIAYGSHTYGAKLLFKQTGANSSLTENLVVDQVYKFSCTISSLTDNSSNMKLNVTGASETSEVLSNGDAVIYFRASHATSNTLRLNGLNSGDTVTISNPSLQKVNGNAGIMKNMASSAIETDTP